MFKGSPCKGGGAVENLAPPFRHRVPGERNEQARRAAAARDRQAEDDALRGVRRNARRQRRQGRVRHRRLGVHGRARPVSAGRHPLHLGRARAGRRPHGRRLLARVRAARRVHRAERARHHQFRHVDGGRVLGAFAGGRHHAGDGQRDARPGRLPGDRAAADLLEDHQVPGARQQPRADGRAHRPRVRPRDAGAAGRPSSTSRATSSTATSNARSRGRSRSSAAPAARRASTRRPICWRAPSSR